MIMERSGRMADNTKMISLILMYILFIGVPCQLVHGREAVAVDSGALSDFSECGIQSGSQPLDIGGNEAVSGGDLPWYAGIYEKTYKPYTLICGGTLVSHNVIISAAQCVWDDLEKVLPASSFAVAVGKKHRAWDDPKDLNAQKSDVSDIIIPDAFQGQTTNYQEDIAIFKVVSPFVFGSLVRPVCLDFGFEFMKEQLKKGNAGKIGSWNDATGERPQALTAVDMPYVVDCIRHAPSGFAEYISSDKMCAGGNGTSLCRGDAGSGLAFPDATNGVTRFYLRGIVSVSPASDVVCNPNAVVAFTDVTKHQHFIQAHL